VEFFNPARWARKQPTEPGGGDFSFAQLSDSHVGFGKGAYSDVVGTFQVAAARLNALAAPPSLVLHTGDLTHLSKPGEFDTVAQVMKSIRTERSFYVPGEHDYFVDEGKEYLERFGKGTLGSGWQSFDYKGVHFIGLVKCGEPGQRKDGAWGAG